MREVYQETQVQRISPPSWGRYAAMWGKIGIFVGGIVLMGFLGLEGVLESLLADLFIPGLGEVLGCVFFLFGLAGVGACYLVGMIVGTIHYSIARSKYQDRLKENI